MRLVQSAEIGTAELRRNADEIVQRFAANVAAALSEA